MSNTYRKEVFRAAVVNQDFRTCHSYARQHGLSTTTANKIWNGDMDITLEKMVKVITPLKLTLADLFAPADGHTHDE